jgi:hypothetical protein
MIIDDNSIDYKQNYLNYKNIKFIQILNEDCDKNGFIDMNFIINKQISGWDKAIYYFSMINTEYKNIWFLEDDVFLYDENTLINIDKKYIDGDLLSFSIHENKNGNKDWWHWKYSNITTLLLRNGLCN